MQTEHSRTLQGLKGMFVEKFNGEHYTADFFTLPRGEPDEYADGIVVVRPPFDFARAERMIAGLTIPGVEFEEYATTSSATVLEVGYGLGGGIVTRTEVEAFDLMRECVRGILKRLNEIESGQFPLKG